MGNILKILLCLYIPLQAALMLFTSDSCDCDYSVSDLVWYVYMQIVMGFLFLNVRDISKTWNKIFRSCGYISFLYAIIYILTFNNLLSNYYWFVFLLVIPYPIALIRVLYHDSSN
jgi:hypothetical protein